MLPFLFGDFVQKWYIPRGMTGECGRLLICDTDRDGNHEFFIRTYGGSQKIYTYELHLPETWEVDSFSYFWGPLVWDIGDFDADGLFDLAIQTAVDTPPNNLISIAESPDSFSYPTQEVWRDTAGFALVQPISTYDVDRDGHVEIFKLGWNNGVYYPFGIYEYIGNSQYDTIFMGTGLGSLTSTIAFGDFDTDSCNEFVVGNINGWYQIWECFADNSYQLVEQQQLPTYNIRDCFSVPDGDGKPEFVVKGYVTDYVNAFIFEAAGNDTYEIIKSFDLPGGHSSYYGGYSDVGDVDGDSIPEIALEACQNIYIIKAASNDSFYVWETLPGNNTGSSIRIYDIDGNGLSEVVISGNDQTRIYEYQVGIAEETSHEVQDARLEVFPNPFSNKLTIAYGLRDMSSKQVIEVRIYDACGRLVKDFARSISTHPSRIIWDGRNNSNLQLPNGIYFLRFEVGNFTVTEKLLMIR
jgi:hypothetical protein